MRARRGRRDPSASRLPKMLMTRRAIEGHEMRANIDVDVVHVALGHGAAIAVVVDQPLHDLLFLARRAEIDGIA